MNTAKKEKVDKALSFFKERLGLRFDVVKSGIKSGFWLLFFCNCFGNSYAYSSYHFCLTQVQIAGPHSYSSFSIIM